MSDKKVDVNDMSDGMHSDGRVEKGSIFPIDTADDVLRNLGYDAELSRNRSTAQVAFMAAILASIPYGLATTFYYPLVGGGPANIIWGWVTVCFIILCLAASLGEVTSVYPTAGGVYYQAFMLAPTRWRRVSGWICGWLYVFGNMTITLAVTFGTTLFIVSCVNVFERADGSGVLDGKAYQVFLIFLAVTIICNAIPAFGNRWLPLLDTATIYWTIAGVIAIITTILAMAKNGRHSAKYVFTHFEPFSGWPAGWSFCIGLLQAGMCEEVQNPAIQVPKAMLITVLFNFVIGLLFLIPILFVLPDIQSIISSSQPLPPIIKSAVGSSGIAFALLIPLMVLAIMCGVGCTTATSRCTWAFARDGAIPGSKWWMKIHPTLGVPANAMLLSTAIEVILGLIYFGSEAAFNAFSGVGVICLTASYAMPIAINLFSGRKKVKTARFNLGPLGWICNSVAVAWALFAVPLFCMPTVVPVDANTMNYAPAVFVGATIVSAAWYWAWGMKNYAGPPTPE